jgi:hypothetical protein
MQHSDVVRGRRLLYSSAATPQWWHLEERKEDLHDINHALAMCDVVGYYVKRGWVDRQDILSLYAPALSRMWSAGEPYVQWRRTAEGWRVWRFFEDLAANLPETSTFY